MRDTLLQLFARVFSLGEIRPGQEGVSLEWAYPLPAWAWTLVVLGAAGLAVLAYRRLDASRRTRVVCAVLRGLALMLVAVMISGPRLVKTEESVQRDWVVVLADRSASMLVRDTPAGSRDQQLKDALARLRPTLEALSPKRELLWLGFSDRVYDVPRPGEGAKPMPEASGGRTLIADSVEQALRRVATRPVAGVVLLSDGRSADEPSRALLRQLQARQIPIFSISLGSETAPARVALRRSTQPGVAFVGDIVPVTVDLDALGPREKLKGAKVELVDEATGAVLDSRELTGNEPENHRLTLTTRPRGEQEAKWIVRSVLPGVGSGGGDDDPLNQKLSVRLRVIDRPIRVALVDGYPRWEYRYLKNLLLRERTIRSSALILSADRRFLQEGSDPLASLPRTKEEWQPFDVVVLGDVRSELLSAEQQAQIKQLVAEKGAGLLWIGGASATPGSYRSTPLADLLPFTMDDSTDAARPYAESVLVSPGAAAERLGVLRLGEGDTLVWPPILSDPNAGWTSLRYAQRIESNRLKPAAEVLARATMASAPVIANSESAGSTPLVITMRYGAGRVIYVATDEIWRWRFGRGETLPERFWLPLIRLLARESLVRGGAGAILEAAPERVAVQQPVQVSLRLVDQSLMVARPASMTVKAQSTDPQAAAQMITLTPRAGGEAGESSGLYSASWTFAEAGDYTLTPTDAALSGLNLSATVEVRDRDDELRDVTTDHLGLARLSDASGGRVLKPEEIARLSELLPNREIRTAGPSAIETLWDKPVVWAVLLTLLCVEWIARRLMRLA
ncbi:MAG: hypothetical protein K2Y21_08355 [Phycisphaerales bacterium]|nr:hypothetical protein [Phycisphaerales bacterium]